MDAIFNLLAVIAFFVFVAFFIKRSTRKQSYYFLAAIFIFLLLGRITYDNTPPTTPMKTSPEVTTIQHTTLRQWNPDSDWRAVGLDILVSENDVTKNNIVTLVRALSTGKDKAVINVYLDKKAWDEDQSGNYSQVHKNGYLAMYIKNLTSNGAYRGFNEVRWMQENGELQELFGTETKM